MIDWLWEERNAVTIRKRVLGEKKRRKEEKTATSIFAFDGGSWMR